MGAHGSKFSNQAVFYSASLLWPNPIPNRSPHHLKTKPLGRTLLLKQEKKAHAINDPRKANLIIFEEPPGLSFCSELLPMKLLASLGTLVFPPSTAIDESSEHVASKILLKHGKMLRS